MTTRRGLSATKKKAPAKKKGKVLKFKRWSYSKYKDYKSCPRMAFLKYINPETKEMDSDNAYTRRGTRVHEGCEKYILGKGKKLPPEMAAFADDFKWMRENKKIITTEKMGVVKADFSEIIPNFNFEKAKWWGPDAPWFFCKLDIEFLEPDDATNAVVIDIKTGKMRGHEHIEQLEIYSLYMFLKYEGVEVVDSGMWYESGETLERRYTRKGDFKKLKTKWTKAPRAMLKDEKFPPKPVDGFPCTYCPFAQGRSGHCEHGPDKARAAQIDERAAKKMAKLEK